MSILIALDKADTEIQRLIESIEKQSYPNIECILLCDNHFELSKDKFKIIVKEDQMDTLADLNLLVSESTGDFLLFMHPNDFFIDDKAIENMMEVIQRKKADVMVCSYTRFKEGKFLFYHYGKDVKVYDIYPSSLPILMNRFNEFSNLYGMMIKKELAEFKSKKEQETIVTIINDANHSIFDTTAYYVVQDDLENSMTRHSTLEIALAPYVPLLPTNQEYIPNTISIALCVDNNYGVYLPTLLYSIDVNHQQRVDVYLFYVELNVELLEIIYQLNQKLQYVSIYLKKIPRYLINHIKTIKTEYTGLAMSTYYRLFISELLPNLDRILYLDIDMLVLKICLYYGGQLLMAIF